ncbi:hypothetical protein PMAYCL1PPCAC_30476, partial [Pristionchus mayeri]
QSWFIPLFLSSRSANMDNHYADAKVYKRESAKRVFVNRSLRLEKIRFFGFDMDYTLAVYKSPELEKLGFDLTVDRLISQGYPEELRTFEYDPIFPVRGLWFDYQYGNLLKVDGFGNILVGIHGIKFLKPSEIEEMYPNKFVQLTSSRIMVLNTLFNLPETHLIAQLVQYFDTHVEFTLLPDKTGVRGGDILISYRSMFKDVRNAVDWVHMDSESKMKPSILANLEKYVIKDDRIVPMLKMLRSNNRKTFLLTNSDFTYTNGVMSYLIDKDWANFFDISIVDACKPKWFAEGTTFREVNVETGSFKLGIHAGPLRPGVIYSGGSCDAFRQMVKARGKDVLYVGDHIFGDVLRSKKTRGWRTFLIVPELDHELTVWTDRKPLFEQLAVLDNTLAEVYKNLDGTSVERPHIESVIQAIRQKSHEMDQEYGVLGSLFRAGSRTTFFASQVERYADLYASSCYNLVHYPSFYFFRAPMLLMPHESTVDHASVHKSARADMLRRQDSVGQQVRGWTRKNLQTENTFCHEEEEEDQGSEGKDDLDSAREKSSSDGETEPLSRTNTDVVVVSHEQVDDE